MIKNGPLNKQFDKVNTHEGKTSIHSLAYILSSSIYVLDKHIFLLKTTGKNIKQPSVSKSGKWFTSLKN